MLVLSAGPGQLHVHLAHFRVFVAQIEPQVFVARNIVGLSVEQRRVLHGVHTCDGSFQHLVPLLSACGSAAQHCSELAYRPVQSGQILRSLLGDVHYALPLQHGLEGMIGEFGA